MLFQTVQIPQGKSFIWLTTLSFYVGECSLYIPFCSQAFPLFAHASEIICVLNLIFHASFTISTYLLNFRMYAIFQNLL